MIDVLLPFYGDPALARETVRSVLAQTDDRWRLVVVDDAYPDPDLRQWLEQLDDPRVDYHRNRTNLGANANYRRALELAQADHLVVMGADDLLLPDFVSVVHEALARVPDAAVVQPGVRVIDADGAATLPLVDRVKTWLRPHGGTLHVLSGERLLVSLLRGNWTYFPSLVWRTDAVRAVGFRPEFHVVQDLALLMDVVRDGGSLVVLPEVVFCYRRHAGSDSSVKTVVGARFEEEQAFYDVAAGELAQAGLPRAARAARTHLTSRAHAAALVPGSLVRRDLGATRRLLRHVTRSGRA